MFAHPKVVFLHVPKTAGVSTLAVLEQSFGAPFPVSHGVAHPTHLLIPEPAKKAPRFCVTRNPWLWHASLYQFCKQRGSALSPLLARLSRDFRDDFETTLPRLLSMSRSDLSFCVKMMAAQRQGGREELAHMGAMIKSIDSLGFYGALHTAISGPECDALCLSRLEDDLPSWMLAKTGERCASPGRLNTSSGPSIAWTPNMIELVRQREPLMVERFGYEFGDPRARVGVWTPMRSSPHA
jgi:hypothetical protein